MAAAVSVVDVVKNFGALRALVAEAESLRDAAPEDDHEAFVRGLTKAQEGRRRR